MFKSRARIGSSATFQVDAGDEESTISSSTSTAERSATVSDQWTFTTQGSFYPGLGSISGKALLAFGKAEIAGIRWIWVQMRKRIISPKVPYRSPSGIPANADLIFDDLLDFCR
jgi:hypothetical protein